MATIPMTRRPQNDRRAAEALAVLDDMFAYYDPKDQTPAVVDEPVAYDLVA